MILRQENEELKKMQQVTGGVENRADQSNGQDEAVADGNGADQGNDVIEDEAIEFGPWWIFPRDM